MLGDQPANLRKAHRLGFAVPPLDFGALTEESLLEALNLALNDPSYRETARRLSGIYLDQQSKPLDRGVYWVEKCFGSKAPPASSKALSEDKKKKKKQ
ncbi:unnamed protein product [Allacma fusca]|uniref:Uncharacterized protein n=1 Tax=Allacma fusca TaxID=39272 RepID=A0A8J2PVS7_9HEXA|nr:unnamed protein product [Allacma fusca]